MRSLSFLVLWVFVLAPFTSLHAAPPATASMSPDAALQKLVEGNKRYVDAKMTHPQQGADRRIALTKGQAPFAVIMSCSDSRVPPEVIFDQGLGDLFIVRVAGNTVDDIALGSIEYGTAVLGSPLILVLGHSQCGAVEATLAGKPLPGHIENIAENIKPALKKNACKADKNQLSCAIGENVNYVVDQLKASTQPVLAGLIKDGKLKVVGGVYDLGSGKVSWMP